MTRFQRLVKRMNKPDKERMVKAVCESYRFCMATGEPDCPFLHQCPCDRTNHDDLLRNLEKSTW